MKLLKGNTSNSSIIIKCNETDLKKFKKSNKVLRKSFTACYITCVAVRTFWIRGVCILNVFYTYKVTFNIKILGKFLNLIKRSPYSLHSLCVLVQLWSKLLVLVIDEIDVHKFEWNLFKQSVLYALIAFC